MRKRILFVVLLTMFCLPVANAAFTSCGPGYVLVESKKKIDDVPSAECQKLWCMDLETGKMMGKDDRANSGYQMSAGANELCDVNNKCVTCWGERKWCGGETRGEWNPEYGAYTRGGNSDTYQSYQKGGCFAWRLEKPKCDDGQTAILQDGQWVCAVATESVNAIRGSAIRRTGAVRRIGR